MAVDKNVSASTQNQALSSLIFLYKHIIHKPLGHLDIVWSKRPVKLPVVLTKSEVQAVFQHLSGTSLLIAQLLYGSGLRFREALGLRVQDIDFGQNLIFVRDGKGHKDRTTPLPTTLQLRLLTQIERVKALHHADLQNGNGRAPLPYALERKYPNAERDWCWQFVFPSTKLSKNPQSDLETVYRFHLHESTVQKAIRRAGKQSGLAKRVSPHIFRHSFATHLLESGTNIRAIQELLGHKDVQTTMIYTHVANFNSRSIQSPLDTLSV